MVTEVCALDTEAVADAVELVSWAALDGLRRSNDALGVLCIPGISFGVPLTAFPRKFACGMYLMHTAPS